MDWNIGNLRVPFVPRPDNTLSFLYNYNYDQFAEMKQQPSMGAMTQHGTLPPLTDKNSSSMNMSNYGVQDPKKKRLSNEQLDLLEKSFEEEIKLDPDRKMKLARELGLHPRQIAVWFQNRRARWKAKQLERLYDALKQDFDALSRDKDKLQQEVLALRTILKEQTGEKRISTEISGTEETVEESTSILSSDINPRSTTNNILHQIAECNYSMNVDDYNNNTGLMIPPYWPPMPSCP